MSIKLDSGKMFLKREPEELFGRRRGKRSVKVSVRDVKLSGKRRRMDRILNLVLYDMARLTRCDLSGQKTERTTYAHDCV